MHTDKGVINYYNHGDWFYLINLIGGRASVLL